MYCKKYSTCNIIVQKYDQYRSQEAPCGYTCMHKKTSHLWIYLYKCKFCRLYKNECFRMSPMEKFEEDLVLHPARDHSLTPSAPYHCVVKISNRCHCIAVKILLSTGSDQAKSNYNFWLDGVPEYV